MRIAYRCTGGTQRCLACQPDLKCWFDWKLADLHRVNPLNPEATMTENDPADEASTLKWLQDDYCTEDMRAHKLRLRLLLAEPRLPKEPSEDALQAMRACDGRINAYALYCTLHTHLAPPKVPTFKVVWRRPGAGHSSGKLARTLFEAMSIATEMVDDGNVVTIEPEA